MGDITYISEERNIVDKKTSLEAGDIVISKGGTVGKIALIPRWMNKCNISQDVIGISLNKNTEIKSEYVAIFLMSQFGQLQIERIKTQQIQPHLTLDYISNLKILIPLEYQEKIVGMIKFAEEANAEALEKISCAKTIFINSLGIDIDKIQVQTTYKVDSRELNLTDILIPKFYYPKYLETIRIMKNKFDTVKLEKIAEIDRGNEVGSKNYRTNLDKSKNDIPFIRTSDIVNFEIDDDPDHHIPDIIYSELDQDLRTGDIIFTKDGKIGLSAMVLEDDKCIIASGLAKIRIK